MGSILPTKLCVIIHNFAHQFFDDLLADGTVLAACQLCNRFCNCANRFIGINDLWLTRRCGILSEKVVDQFDHHTMKARSVFVRLLF